MFVRQSRIKYVQDTITTRFLVLKWVGRDSFRHNVRIILQLHGKSTDYSRIILDALVYLLCSKLCEHNPPKPMQNTTWYRLATRPPVSGAEVGPRPTSESQRS